MYKFFVMMSVAFVMALGMVGNASADEGFIDYVEDDFYLTDNVWEDPNTKFGLKVLSFPVTFFHDAVKSALAAGGILLDSVVKSGKFSIDVGEFVFDKTVDVGKIVINSHAVEVVVDSYTTDTLTEENWEAYRNIVVKSVIVPFALIFDAVKGTGNLMENTLAE